MSQTQITNLITPPVFRIPATIALFSNPSGSKTAKLTITARSSDAVYVPGWGRVVHDFSGMTNKQRVPVDMNHDQCDSIGYVNKFDTSSGDLVCSGALVLDMPIDDDCTTTELATKIAAGVPYEASIQFNDDCTLEIVPEGQSVSVNNEDFVGPLIVVRQWELLALAICKFGMDSATSTEVQFSKNVDKEKKGYFVTFAKNNTLRNTIMSNQANQGEAVETTVEAKAVETVVKAEDTQLSEHKVEAVVTAAVDPVQAPAVVDEVKPVEVKPVDDVAQVAVAMQEVPASDPRCEFKKFVDAFGNDKAATYFAAGKSFSEATIEHLTFQAAEIADLKKRLSAVDRGADKPVKFSDTTDALDGNKSTAKGMAALIKISK